MRLRRIIAFNFDCRVGLCNCRFFVLEVFNSNNLLSEAVVGLKLFYPKSFRKQFCAFLKAPNFTDRLASHPQNVRHKACLCLFVFNLDGMNF